MVRPCVPHDGRLQNIANCCCVFLAIGIMLSIIVGLPLVLTRSPITVTVENASLATFSVAPPPMAPTTTPAVAEVTYNLSMTVTVHNPNRFLGVDFTMPLEARYSFDGTLVGQRVWLFSEGEKLRAGFTKVCRLVMGPVGETALGLTSARVLEVDMMVAGHYRVGGAKRSLVATCALRLPVGALSSEKVKCL